MKANTYRIVLVLSAAIFIGLLVFGATYFQSEEPIAPTVLDTPFIGSTLQTSPIVTATGNTQVVVRYTDTGFEPSDIQVVSDTKVRFENASRFDMWVRAAGEGLYPPDADSCGVSALDTCEAIPTGGSWEVTLEKPGFWTYWNERNHDMKGVVRII